MSRFDDNDAAMVDAAMADLTASASRPAVAAADDGLVGARMVEILPGGSERAAVGGGVVEARAVVDAALPPIAACAPVVPEEPEPNVVVCKSVMLPAGGLVEVQYALAVDVEVVDAPAPRRLRRDAAGTWVRAAPPLVEGAHFSVDAFPS